MISVAELLGAFVCVHMSREEKIHAQLLQLPGEFRSQLFVLIAVFILVLFAAVGGVVGIGNQGLLAEYLASARGELNVEEVGEVVELLLEGNLEEAGVAGPVEPGE